MQDEYEKICYKKNYITEVICRLDFASPVSIFNQTVPKDIFEVVKKYFPIVEPKDIIGTELILNPINSIVIPNQVVQGKEWVFLSRNRKDICKITTNAIVFSINNYTVFEEAKNSFIDIITVIMRTNPNNQGKRFGLRYKNDIPLKGHENWINNKFSTALYEHKNKETTRLLTKFEYSLEDKDLKVILTYGYNNPDYPAIMKNENFMIDIDVYNQGMIYQEDLSQFIDYMHFEIQKCFENMITDYFRKKMNSINK